MKALAILGSPRGKTSSSSRAAEHFTTGLRAAGYEIEEIMLCDRDIKPCRGCFTCWTKTPGTCVHRDDMDILLPALLRTQLIVYAFPLYIYSVPGIVKNFLDRQIPLFRPELVERNGITAHPPRDPAMKNRIFLLSVAGFPERSHFDGLLTMFEKTFSSDHNKLIGKILIGGAETMRLDAMQSAYADLYRLLETAGREVGTNGAMRPETERAIIERTTISSSKMTAFRDTANQYWQSFTSVKPKTVSVGPKARELKVSDGGLNSYWAGMALQYDPSVLPGFEGGLQFCLDDAAYFLAVAGKTCRAYAGLISDPVTTITTSRAVWMDVAAGKINGQQAVMEGRIKVSGEFGPMLRLTEMFGRGKKEPGAESSRREKAESLPDHRGPIQLKGMVWLTLVFVPWILKWLWVSPSNSPLTLIVPGALMLLIFLYHLISNRPTLFEIGSVLYLSGAAVLNLLGIGVFTQHQFFFDNLFLSMLWMGSLMRTFPLTAEYSRFEFPKSIWINPAFLKTNVIITGAWGLYYLAGIFCDFLSNSGLANVPSWHLAYHILIIPMIVFTLIFQKRYPAFMLKKQH
jgi:hypothetical protein